MSSDESSLSKPKDISRRDFLKLSGAALVGAKLPRPFLNLPPTSNSKESSKTAEIELHQQMVIEKYFELQPNGKSAILLPPEKIEVEWPPTQKPEYNLEELNTTLTENGLSPVKLTPYELCQKAVERYQEIRENPYEGVLDPTAKEVDALVEEYSKITGLPEDFIYTLWWREHYLTGLACFEHFSETSKLLIDYSKGKDGALNPWVRVEEEKGTGWAELREIEGKQIEIVKFRAGPEHNYSLPIPSQALAADTKMNLSFGLAIYVHQLSWLASNPEAEAARSFLESEQQRLLLTWEENNDDALKLEKLSDKWKTSKEDTAKRVALMGVSYTLYHQPSLLLEESINNEPQYNLLIQTTQLAENTIYQYRPWENKAFIQSGQTQLTKECEYYYPFSQKEAEEMIPSVMKKELQGSWNEIENSSNFASLTPEQQAFLRTQYEKAREQLESSDSPNIRIKSLKNYLSLLKSTISYPQDIWEHGRAQNILDFDTSYPIFKTLAETELANPKQWQQLSRWYYQYGLLFNANAPANDRFKLLQMLAENDQQTLSQLFSDCGHLLQDIFGKFGDKKTGKALDTYLASIPAFIASLAEKPKRIEELSVLSRSENHTDFKNTLEMQSLHCIPLYGLLSATGGMYGMPEMESFLLHSTHKDTGQEIKAKTYEKLTRRMAPKPTRRRSAR
jgi:hypothetical protein